MAMPILDVFRFWTTPAKPFPYLGAMWIIECKLGTGGDHWECATTAPLRLSLVVAENERALRTELTERGIPVIRNTQHWFLLQHLALLGFVEQINPPHR